MSASDEEAEMAKMMGFSGFSSGTKPPPSKKRKHPTTSSPSSEARAAPPRGIPLGNSKGPNPNLIAVPATRPPRQDKPSPTGSDEPPHDDDQVDGGKEEERPAAEVRGGGFMGGGWEDDVLAKPLDGLTTQDLARLRYGVKMADGRSVFFLPSFLEDPWA
jgi:hypothetical protein